MKTLLLLRHARAHDVAATDHARPLTEAGVRAARRAGEALVEWSLVPDLVIASSAVRARATAQAVIAVTGYTGAVHTLDELYLSGPMAYLQALRRWGTSSERVLVVGHNPGIETLLEQLTGQRQAMATATLVECALPLEAWSDIGPKTQGALRRLFAPPSDIHS
ncbi:MAG TPA: histidine phosphatase family protein [Polyangiaceae bacterium]|nr:histidine phosphatase family protein [Polyangiaceae bacterium]